MKIVKNALIILGFLAAVAASIFFGLKVYNHYKAKEYAATAVPYLKRVVPEISRWDVAVIREYMPAETLARIPDDKIRKIVDSLSRLGALKHMGEPVFSSVDSSAVVADKPATLVIYDVDLQYEKGNAVMTLSLLPHGKSYQVQNFNVQSKALAR